MAADREHKIKYIVYSSMLQRVDLLNLVVCLYVSDYMAQNAVFGGALYISAIVWICFARLFGAKSPLTRTRRFVLTGVLVFLLSILIDVALLIYYPSITGSFSAIVMAAYVAFMVMRTMLTDLIAARVHGPYRPLALGIVHLSFIGGVVLVFYSNSANFWQPLMALGGYALGGVLLFGRQLLMRPAKVRKQNIAISKSIYSYNVYSNMALWAYMAFYLSIITSVIYMIYTPGIDIAYDYWYVLIWLVLVFFLSCLAYSLILRGKLRQWERGVVFAFGAVAWVIAGVFLYNSLFANRTTYVFLWGLLWGVGMALMNAVITCVREDLRPVSRLASAPVDEAALEQRTEISQNTALMISGLIALVLMTALSVISSGGDQYDLSQTPEMQGYFRLYMTFLPMVFIMVSAVFALVQPIDRRYTGKLGKYNALGAGAAGKPLEGRLIDVLVKKYKRRFGVRILRALIRPLYHHKVIGRENVAKDGDPVIFVCNHGEIYGPIAAVLYLPFFFRPWIINKMLDKDLIFEHMYSGTFERIHWLPRPLGRGIARAISPLVRWVLQSVDPIPVFREYS